MESSATTKKLGVGSTVAVFVAYTCSVSTVPNGARLSEGATFATGLGGIVLGFGIGALIAIICSWIGYKTGLGKDAIWKQIFGRRGFMICSFIFGFCQAFWACFDFFNAGQALYNLMPEGSLIKNVGFCVAICVMLVLTIIGGVYGISGVKWISTLTIPIAIVLFAIIYFCSFKEAGGFAGLTAYVPAEATLKVTDCAQIMYGMWMAGFIGMMDLTTNAKNTKCVVIASILSVAFIGLCFMVGQVGFIGTGMKTVGDLCLSLGGAVFICGNLFVILAQSNTTPACNLMYSNSFSAGLNVPRKPVAIVVPIIVAVLAFVIMYGPSVDFISRITDTVSALMAPLIGVQIAEFYIVCKKNYKIKPVEELPVLRPTAFICLLIGVALSFVFNNISGMPLPGVFTIIITGLLHTIGRLGLKLN